MNLMPITIFIAVLVVVVGGFFWYHEAVHQQIFAAYGVNSTMMYRGLVWEVLPGGEVDSSDLRTVNALQVVNEAFGYQFGILLVLNLLVLFVVMVK